MPQPKARVVVVGAGIAGLSCAIALTQAGADVEVVERVQELREVGGAVSLTPNALAALGRLGVGKAIRAVGWPEPAVTIRSSSGRDLVKLSADQVQGALGGEILIVHRADLQNMLLQAAREVSVRLSWACAGIESVGATISVRSEAGDELLADAVVGCDGVRSVVGTEMPGQHKLHYQGVTTWRAVLDRADLVDSAWLAVGEGKQFVASPLAGSRCYWSPMLRMREGANAQLTDPIDFLARAFAGWPAPIPTLIDQTEPSSVIRADVYDRMPTRLADGRIALAGDAGHPMTPALGQGACQAIVDAAVLGAAWQQCDDPVAAFSAYEKARLGPARRVVADSRRVNRVFASRSRVVDGVNQRLAALLPSRIQLSMIARHASRDAFLRCLARLENPS